MNTLVDYNKRTTSCPECGESVRPNNWKRHFEAHHPAVEIPDFPDTKMNRKASVRVPKNGSLELRTPTNGAMEPQIIVDDALDHYHQSLSHLQQARHNLEAERSRLMDRIHKIDEVLNPENKQAQDLKAIQLPDQMKSGKM